MDPSGSGHGVDLVVARIVLGFPLFFAVGPCLLQPSLKLPCFLGAERVTARDHIRASGVARQR